MNESYTLEIINKIFINVFEKNNTFSLEEILNKFAYDIDIPRKVTDYLTNEITWTDSIDMNKKFITNKNMQEKDIREGWMQEKRNITNLEDLINIWQEINLTTTERVYDSVNVTKSDTIYRCENVYQSSDCSDSKNIIYCESCGKSNYLLASKRSGTCSFSIRIDDSKECSNSYNVICSNKISNSIFIQDCSSLYECMFCSHISNKKYCIANMQFEEDEYFYIKKEIVNWLLSKN